MRVVLLLALCSCSAGDPCQRDADCKEGRVCDAARGSCAEAAQPVVLDLWSPPRPDLRPPDDLRPAADLRPAPDLAAKACVFDRDCGDAAMRCCVGVCRAYLDRDNCGACGTSCGPDPAVTCCADIGAARARCVNIKTDRYECGRCGNVCPPLGQPWPPECCDGVCTDTRKDANNCGICGRVCPPPKMCFNLGGGGGCQ